MNGEWIPGTAIGLLGVATLVSGTRTLKKARDSQRWASTQGRVVDVGFHIGTAASYRDTSAVIEYEYQANGKQYRSNCYDFAGSGFDTRAASLVAQYDPGQSVTVYYDPDRPEVACLQPATGTFNYLMVVLGLALMLVGFILSVSALRAPAG